MADKLGSSHIIKIGIVTHDVEATAARFRAIFTEAPPPASQTEVHPPFTIKPFAEYHGQPVSGAIPMKVISIYTDNFWFELIEPIGDTPSPWKDHLDQHGTSVCFTSIHIEDGFDHDAKVMSDQGYPMIWLQDKGYERYAYFDTTDQLGLLIEVKERRPK